jgi:hypothetical protein
MRREATDRDILTFGGGRSGVVEAGVRVGVVGVVVRTRVVGSSVEGFFGVVWALAVPGTVRVLEEVLDVLDALESGNGEAVPAKCTVGKTAGDEGAFLCPLNESITLLAFANSCFNSARQKIQYFKTRWVMG